ncbi:molecular chaperone HtpG [Clostridium saccharobutylicum]|uniref:Chaperone protein HtpG n=1 Tax=Clostridium saccharobutylicum DSM 13864 TaxID=1345695 RepID=U5MVM4_CLOSA|nr:molecular chaperone HtpG [Clostridium saccharobutylicum]AGX44844.1 chaperone protein HtpG [Clostridium saccharobutylicum DSM 13864]AQR92127.1 chaperone protein HtpG [Clostridium saccharobutylicum]AQS02029.1 chaperone protein HtpG [Clostridium saccharobutylicum]AQS16012.1 chaperone protein HtpG [Clostridium saccharobutylicum]MBA2903629.1 molecular chaperone HtpG [Clostridium saccharobutylicum]
MIKENGNISIDTENIFPIIKKWLYSDKDIFIREVISNACDAISKFQRLVSLGEANIDKEESYKVTVSINKENKTLKFIDNGIGMTEEEVKKYITQVAFSGATDFVEKYKDKMDEGKDIIGHFGLGFYSTFMVSDKVQIDTLSYKSEAEAVKWVCNEGGTEYEISTSEERTTRGTTITLYINEESKEFLEEYKVREIIKKYCSFLPTEIYLEDENKPKEEPKYVTKKKEDGTEYQELVEPEAPKPLNDTKPLWIKAPKDCTDEEYKDFYRKVFMDFNEPLFWIHLNVDYPFNLKGILYFPKLTHEFEATEGQVKLYNNQVFVADNIKEVIPDFLLLLKGTIDCPDLPLNVSRSFLQNDKEVSKISNHIIKKVADKLVDLFKNSREEFNKFWPDIQIFIKYGCLRDQKFYEKIKDIIIFKNLKDEFVTLKDYLEANKEKHENKVFYVNDEKQQSQYIKMFKEYDLDAVILNCSLDDHFISFLEMHESGVKFNRIDSDISDTLGSKTDENDETQKALNKEIEHVFKTALGEKVNKLSVEALKNTETPALILVSEESRRMAQMSKMYAKSGMNFPGMFNEEKTLVVNNKNTIIKKLVEVSKDDSKKDEVRTICEHIMDLAKIANKELDANEMDEFIKRSNQLLSRVIEL